MLQLQFATAIPLFLITASLAAIPAQAQSKPAKPAATPDDKKLIVEGKPVDVPATPPPDATNTFPFLSQPALKALAKDELFYHLLGASTEVLGFDDNGDLRLGFGSPRRSHAD